MTKPNTIKLTVSIEDAYTVGLLVLGRFRRKIPVHSALLLAPEAAKRLLNKARQQAKRSSTGVTTVTVPELSKAEATALFYLLAIFFHPESDAENFLKQSEIEKVRSVALALAEKLLAKPGKPAQEMNDDDHDIQAYEQTLRGIFAKNIDVEDPASISRKRKRLARRQKILATPLNPIPTSIQALISKKTP